MVPYLLDALLPTMDMIIWHLVREQHTVEVPLVPLAIRHAHPVLFVLHATLLKQVMRLLDELCPIAIAYVDRPP